MSHAVAIVLTPLRICLSAHHPTQSKWTRIPKRSKRGPKFEGYAAHIRGALAAADARKTRLVLDGLGGRHQDTTGTQARCVPAANHR
jgi:hypothetical protein